MAQALLTEIVLKIQSYTSLQGASNEYKLGAKLRNLNVHDVIESLLSFNRKFLPLQVIFDDYLLIFVQNLQVRYL